MTKPAGRVDNEEIDRKSTDEAYPNPSHRPPIGGGRVDELESGITGRPETSWDEYGTSRDEYQERDNETSTDSGNPAPAVLSDEARAEALERTRRWLTDQGKGLGLSERQAQERAALIVSGFAAPPPSVLYDDDADSGGLDETDGGGH